MPEERIPVKGCSPRWMFGLGAGSCGGDPAWSLFGLLTVRSPALADAGGLTDESQVHRRVAAVLTLLHDEGRAQPL